MKKFDFYISYLCANKCAFCCVLDKINWFKENGLSQHMSLPEVKAILYAKHQDGFGYITLTGGEPTIHPDFIEILKFAKKLNMRISVNSNMGKFADPDFSCAALPLIDEVVASIHGHTAELHNGITGTTNSFQKFTAAMENIHKMKPDLYLITDTVMTTQNIGCMSEIVGFLMDVARPRHVLFSNVNLPPDKLEGREHLVPTLMDIEKVLPEIVERIAIKGNKILRFYGVPFCSLGNYSGYSSDLFFEPKKVIERIRKNDEMVDREYSAPKPVLAKKKTDKCRPCVYYKTCGGFFNSYHMLFGDDHITPVLNRETPAAANCNDV